MDNFSPNTKLEIAVEILATKIAMYSKNGMNLEDEKFQELIKDRDEMYKGNEKVIEKIIKQYGPEIKKYYEEV